MFACGVSGGGGLTSGQPRLVLLGVDKRTGQVLRPEQSFEGMGYVRFLGEPDKKAIQVHLQRDIVTLQFSDQPPPKPSTSKAILKALGGAAGGLESLDISPAVEEAVVRQILGETMPPPKPVQPAPPPAKPPGQAGKQPAPPDKPPNPTNKESRGAKP
jgi:hypothetical protein